ncbi:MAG: hypothetical protein U0527_11200 [Candidatus Eisenbacteria bacterium]
MTARTDKRGTRRAEEGMGTIPAFFLISLSAFLVFLVAAMFMTGVAQRYLVPILKQKAIGLADTVEGRKPAASAADSSAADAPADSLRGLLTQIETERTMLDQEKLELRTLRGSIDSLMVNFKQTQSSEATRQAALLGKMLPDEAALILEQMDDASLNAVLTRMTPKQASRVMSKLDPSRMARLAMQGIGTETMADLSAPIGASAPTSIKPQSGGNP